MKCRKAALIINPRDGKNFTKTEDILAIFAAAGWETEVFLKEYGGHAIELAASAASSGRDLIVAYGGDGTLNQVVNGVMETEDQRSIVGIIPGGTANVWAGEIHVPDDPVKAALVLVNSVVQKVDIGLVQVEGITFPDDQENLRGKRKSRKKSTRMRQHFLLMAGLGIDAAIMGHVSKSLKYQIGPLAVGASAAMVLPAQHPFPVEIQVDDEGTSWEGEAFQLVIGNTRRYADVLKMTDQAYADDGMLDLCVITAGDPLTTIQQIISLLLHRKPDALSTKYFHGAHLTLRVPASVALQLDGSAIDLKDYLNKSEWKMLSKTEHKEAVMVTYRFDVIPRALQVAIPRTYNDTLFQSASTPQDIPSQEAEAQDSGQPDDHSFSEQRNGRDAPESVKAVQAQGRRVTVVGVGLHPGRKHTYIVAGTFYKKRTGEARPVAVCLDHQSALRRQNGEPLALEALADLREGGVIVVEGKKNKRGVIWAKDAIIEKFK